LCRRKNSVKLQRARLPKYLLNHLDAILSDSLLAKFVHVLNCGVVAMIVEVSPNIPVSLSNVPLILAEPVRVVRADRVTCDHNTFVAMDTAHDDVAGWCDVCIHYFINGQIECDLFFKE